MRRFVAVLVGSLWLMALAVAAQGQDPYEGWNNVPKTAASEKNPFPVNPALIAAGQKVYNSKCARCHGPKGLGDGVDADTDLQKDMDLTRADRAAVNPDGVVFYKVMYGRQEPRMPPFEDQLTKDAVWAVVAYTQTLRTKK
jgi:mono/diheme cytochrome c family protein